MIRAALAPSPNCPSIEQLSRLCDAAPPALAPGAATGPEVFRSEEVILESPAGDLATAPKQLRWFAAPAAHSYSVELMEVDRTMVFSAESREPKLALPASVRARVV